MAYQRPDLEDEWEGFEPEQPPRGRWILWLGAGAVILFLIGICLIGGYLLIQQFQSRTVTTTPLVMPTSPVTVAPTPEGLVSPTATNRPLAPTATLGQPEPPPTPLIGAGNVEAAQFSSPPTINGDLSEWVGVGTTKSTFLVHSAGSWDGTDDVAAAWRLGWDGNNLYIAVEVIDDLHVQTQTGNQIFRGDSVDMQFDTDRAGDYADGLSPDDLQIIFSPGDFAGLLPSAFRFQGTSGGRILDAPGGHNVIVAAVATPTGYILEAAIPWSDLNLVPAPGLVLGLALNANDNDLPGEAVQEVMKSHVSTRTLTNPTTWGTLTLK
jgi:hypothetical protein